jgi:hypothetical protein
MSSITLHRPVTSVDGAKASIRAHRREPAYQAYLLLRTAFTVLPLAMGIDKYFNSMVDWPMYLAGWIHNILPGTPQQVMYGVGGAEILAGVLIALKPRYAAYVVAAWLAGIATNLFSYPGFYDIAVRDSMLMVAALALGRLASRYDSPLRLRALRAHPSDDD